MEHLTPQSFVSSILASLREAADPQQAIPMAAYLKADVEGFFGIKKPALKEIFGQHKKRFQPANQADLHAAVEGLWEHPKREARHLAIHTARAYKTFQTREAMPLYERMIREGAWWDTVDDISANLVGTVYRKHPQEIRPVMDQWIEDPDLWIRRSALLCQLRFKEDTDQAQLFSYCLACVEEKEFFIRKAIGWALRQYSKAAPEAVADFLCTHKDKLSGLSYREGAKHLRKLGAYDL